MWPRRGLRPRRLVGDFLVRALIVTGRMVQDQELVYPQYRLQEAGYEVTIAADDPEFRGIQGVKFSANVSLNDEAELLDDYELVVVPGGVKCMEHLRLSKAALYIVQEQHRRGGVVAAICSGVQLLISAGLVRGRHAAIYRAFRVDLENAGGLFVDMPAVIDERIVTSSHYRHLGPWMAAALIAVASR